MATSVAMPVSVMAARAAPAAGAEPQAAAPGVGAALDAVVGGAARFRIEFSRDARTKELRWVLFTASKRGAVGKIIFTLEAGGAAAHIKSLAVNREWRGLGLARVLFLACRATLTELGVRRIDLEAEEDAKRHGKLVGLYEEWGFTVTPGAKVLFLYNDAECFRKVPMSLPLPPRPLETGNCGGGGSGAGASPPVPAAGQWFCMLTLRAADGSCLAATEQGAIEARAGHSRDSVWQTLLDAASGEVFLRSAHGKFLCVEESGLVLADRPHKSTWETFRVVPLLGERGVALRSFHGGYLSIDSERHTVVSTSAPVPWGGNGDLTSLVCSQQGPPLFARLMRTCQTAAFAKRQATKFGAFERASWSLREACQRVAELTDEPRLGESWVLRYMLASAEAARGDGHPDWLQLAVFLRALGLLFLRWTDEDNAVLRGVSAREWLDLNSTWLVGARIPESIEFPELSELNTDHTSGGAPSASCQDVLDDALLLPWTPDEYLYRALVHNRASLPSEALAVIRLWSLKTWYRDSSYADQLTSPLSADTKEWLASLVRFSNVSDAALQQAKPETLLPYYLSLADKYLPAVMHW